MNWKKLCGKRTLMAVRTDVKHPFDDAANGIALYLADEKRSEGSEMTVLIFEDPDDGYRSHAAEPLIANAPLYAFGISPDYICTPVRIREWTKYDGGSGYCGSVSGLEFIDRRNKKVILRVGTQNTDDYYPSFVCDWTPENLAVSERD